MSCEQHRDFIQLRQLYIDIIGEYKKILDCIVVLRKDCIIAKSAGVAAGVVGVGAGAAGFIIGLALAPITLGGSLLLSTTVGVSGLVTAGLGGLTVSGTNLVKSRKVKGYLATLEILERGLRSVAERSESTFMKVMNTVEACLGEGNSREETLAYLVTCMKEGVQWEDMDVGELSERIRMLQGTVVRRDEVMKWCTRQVVGEVAIGGSNAVMKAGSGVALAFADDIVLSTSRFAQTAIATNVARAIASGVGVALGGIFVAVDIYDLVKDVKNPIELGQKIEEAKSSYEESLKTVEDILTLFSAPSIV